MDLIHKICLDEVSWTFISLKMFRKVKSSITSRVKIWHTIEKLECTNKMNYDYVLNLPQPIHPCFGAKYAGWHSLTLHPQPTFWIPNQASEIGWSRFFIVRTWLTWHTLVSKKQSSIIIPLNIYEVSAACQVDKVLIH